MKGKISRYTLLNDADRNWDLYNTLSGSLIRITEKDMQNNIKALLTQKNQTFICDLSDPFFLTLYQNGFILPADEDETISVLNMYEQNVVNTKLLKVFPIVTRQCNFRCRYCYEKHENKHMSAETFTNISSWILDLLYNRIFQQVHINFFGGEPLLGYDKIISFLKQLNSGLSRIGIDTEQNSFGMTTNGYLLELDKFIELHHYGVKTYQITIDGTEEKHNTSRPLKNGQKSWAKIIENLKQISLTDKDFEIIIRTNYDEEILTDQLDFFNFISKTFDSRFSVYFEPIKRLGGEKDDELKVVNELEEIVVAEELFQAICALGLRNTTLDYMYGPCGKVCYAAESGSFVVDYDGTLKKCTLALDDDRNTVGVIHDKGYEIDSKKHAPWITNSFINHAQCRECKVLPLCFGKKCPKAFVINELDNIRCDTDELMVMQYMHVRS